MLIYKTSPDLQTFPYLIKSCSSLRSLSTCFSVHQHCIVFGFSSNALIASSLVGVYSKLGESHYARQVFDAMPERSVVAWSAIIGCYSKLGDVNMAFSMCNQMRNEGVRPNSVTTLGLLAGISQVGCVECVHACAIRLGFESDIVLMNCLLNVYGRCGSVEIARVFFEFMDHRDSVSWSSLVSCYTQNGCVEESVEISNRMRAEELKPDHQIFGSVVSVAGNEMKLEVGRMAHGQIIRAGFENHVQVETTLMVMYLKCGEMDDALRTFNQITDRDVVSLTAMISGLVRNGRADEALNVFHQMRKQGVMPASTTIASALAACAQLNSPRHGTAMHGFIVRRRMDIDIAVQNSLVSMYAKCSRLEQSLNVFKRMPSKDVVTWNALLAAYAQNGNLYEAMCLLNEMKMARQRPDYITVVSLLQACASLGALLQGKWIHNFLLRHRVGPCISIDTALVDMYSKCGNIDDARKCFDLMPEKDLVSWSTIIAGYGSHGKGETALKMYNEFLQTGIQPNHVTFLAILSACSHAGLVSQGMRIFESIMQDYGHEPTVEHRACIVDLLSRAGRLEEAYDFVKRMFKQPSISVLGILLDACCSHRNADLADMVRREIQLMKPVDAADYVQLAHSYASTCKWGGKGEALMQMRGLGLKKVPGWSSIEFHGAITTFLVDHSSHSQYEEIVSMLRLLRSEMQKTRTLQYQ
ncbi:hypothetical protein Syun_009949 [Stephania yunnanensis]|uniref:Pentatricopeptide repeat-containing protein n=1 Tax=Stephania yunnanensis TaxID=152371 RepID=A0AAP0KGL0_9MAGN